MRNTRTKRHAEPIQIDDIITSRETCNKTAKYMDQVMEAWCDSYKDKSDPPDEIDSDLPKEERFKPCKRSKKPVDVPRGTFFCPKCGGALVWRRRKRGKRAAFFRRTQVGRRKK